MRSPSADLEHGRRRFLRSSLACAGTIAAWPWPAGAREAAASDDRPWIPSEACLDELPERMRVLAVPGVGIAVVEDGEVAWTRSLGVADAGTRRPVDADTVFECASLSKPVFAYLVMQCVDEGRIGLDDPLVRHYRPDYLAKDPRLDHITVRDVLRHTSGLINWRAHPQRELLATQFEPGSRIGYSGEAFFWLQLVLEHLTGESLDAMARHRLFEPAGMADSSYTWSEGLAARSVTGQPAPDAEGMPLQTFRNQWSHAQSIAERWGKPLSTWTWADAVRALPQAQATAPPGLFVWPGDLMANAAASLRGPVQDYARFIVRMMDRHAREAWEIAPASRRAMLSPQAPLRAGWIDKGLGWNLERTPYGRWFYHGGSNAGLYKTFVVGDAGRRRGLVVMTNGGGGTGIYQRIVRDATGRNLLAFDP